MVKDPKLLQLRRLIIGEAARFPELGRTDFERGPGRTVDTLAAWFQRLARRGLLRADDPRLAARLFNWLVLSIPLNRAMFFPEATFTKAELKRLADEAVRIFLAGHSPTPNSGDG